ncbi:CHAP domain-containing protein [Bifidobacterium apri]|uniref:CHAP domain-containing protein n=1 Tax=Bifidobacterium apri TaxID=1769423 RepID=UPI003996ADB8
MKHAARKATQSGRGFRVADVFAPSHRGSHAAHSVRAVRADGGEQTLGLDPVLAAKLEEVAPLTRRAIRESARAARRKSRFMASGSMVALAGAAAAAISFSNMNASTSLASSTTATGTVQTAKSASGSSVSRSQERTSLGAADGTTSSGNWSLGSSNSDLDVSQMSQTAVSNPVVAVLYEADKSLLPSGFDPNHDAGDSGNQYSFSQCTWWAYVRRHQLGLPVGSHLGDGAQWAASAKKLGYWVDTTPRHVGDVIVFQRGQFGSSTVYGHVAIVEQINADGSIVTSECGASLNGKTVSRTFTADQALQLQFIHY